MVFGHFFQHFKFTEAEIQDLEIMHLEGLTYVLWIYTLCKVCPERIAGRRFVTWCDNEPFQIAVTESKSNCPTIAFLLQILHDLQARFSFDLRCNWIDTKSNRVADALSRGEIEEFRTELKRLGVNVSCLRFVPIEQDRRCAWTSRMRRLRRLENDLRTAPEPSTS